MEQSVCINAMRDRKGSSVRIPQERPLERPVSGPRDRLETARTSRSNLLQRFHFCELLMVFQRSQQRVSLAFKIPLEVRLNGIGLFDNVNL